MANQVSLGVLTRPGDEIVCDAGAHCMSFESGALAALWGVQARTIVARARAPRSRRGRGGDPPGATTSTRARASSRSRTRTTAAAAPSTRSTASASSARWPAGAASHLHLDGARLWNACAATGIAPAELRARGDDRVGLPLEGARRAGGLARRGPARPHRRGAPAPQAARRRHAPGRASSPRRGATRSSTTARGSPRITRTRAGSRTASPRSVARRSRSRSRRTSSSSPSPAGARPRSRRASRARACSRTRRARGPTCSASSRTSTSRAPTWTRRSSGSPAPSATGDAAAKRGAHGCVVASPPRAPRSRSRKAHGPRGRVRARRLRTLAGAEDDLRGGGAHRDVRRPGGRGERARARGIAAAPRRRPRARVDRDASSPRVRPSTRPCVRFAAEARDRRAAQPGGRGFPDEAAKAWRTLAADLDAYLGPRAPADAAPRARPRARHRRGGVGLRSAPLRRAAGRPHGARRPRARRASPPASPPPARSGSASSRARSRRDSAGRWSRRGFSSLFGMRTHPLDGRRRMHFGVDLAADAGRVVAAAANGLGRSRRLDGRLRPHGRGPPRGRAHDPLRPPLRAALRAGRRGRRRAAARARRPTGRRPARTCTSRSGGAARPSDPLAWLGIVPARPVIEAHEPGAEARGTREATSGTRRTASVRRRPRGRRRHRIRRRPRIVRRGSERPAIARGAPSDPHTLPRRARSAGDAADDRVVYQ